MDVFLIQLVMILLALASFQASRKTYRMHKKRLEEIMKIWDPIELSKAKYIERPYIALTYFLSLSGIILLLSGINLWRFPITIQFVSQENNETVWTIGPITVEMVILIDLIGIVLLGVPTFHLWKYKYKKWYELFQRINLFVLEVIFVIILGNIWLMMQPNYETIIISGWKFFGIILITELFGMGVGVFGVLTLISLFAGNSVYWLGLFSFILDIYLTLIDPFLQFSFALTYGLIFILSMNLAKGFDLFFTVFIIMLVHLGHIFRYFGSDYFILYWDYKVFSKWVLASFIYYSLHEKQEIAYVDIALHEAVDDLVFDKDKYFSLRTSHYEFPLKSILSSLSKIYIIKEKKRRFVYQTVSKHFTKISYIIKIYDNMYYNLIYFPEIPHSKIECVEFRLIYQNKTVNETAKLCNMPIEHVLLALTISDDPKAKAYLEALKKGEQTMG